MELGGVLENQFKSISEKLCAATPDRTRSRKSLTELRPSLARAASSCGQGRRRVEPELNLTFPVQHVVCTNTLATCPQRPEIVPVAHHPCMAVAILWLRHAWLIFPRTMQSWHRPTSAVCDEAIVLRKSSASMPRELTSARNNGTAVAAVMATEPMDKEPATYSQTAYLLLLGGRGHQKVEDGCAHWQA